MTDSPFDNVKPGVVYKQDELVQLKMEVAELAQKARNRKIKVIRVITDHHAKPMFTAFCKL